MREFLFGQIRLLCCSRFGVQRRGFVAWVMEQFTVRIDQRCFILSNYVLLSYDLWSPHFAIAVSSPRRLLARGYQNSGNFRILISTLQQSKIPRSSYAITFISSNKRNLFHLETFSGHHPNGNKTTTPLNPINVRNTAHPAVDCPKKQRSRTPKQRKQRRYVGNKKLMLKNKSKVRELGSVRARARARAPESEGKSWKAEN